MFLEISSELKALQKKSFTGVVKFGIEKGSVVALNLNSQSQKFSNKDILDFENIIKSLVKIEAEFYGTLEFCIENDTWNYSITYRGEELKNELRESRSKKVVICKSVNNAESK